MIKSSVFEFVIMKNIHIVYSNFNDKQVKILGQHGILVQVKYDRFDIEENETYWKLKPYLDTWEIHETVNTKFTVEEEDNARRLVLLSPWANGYPMPDSDNGYKSLHIPVTPRTKKPPGGRLAICSINNFHIFTSTTNFSFRLRSAAKPIT